MCIRYGDWNDVGQVDIDEECVAYNRLAVDVADLDEDEEDGTEKVADGDEETECPWCGLAVVRVHWVGVVGGVSFGLAGEDSHRCAGRRGVRQAIKRLFGQRSKWMVEMVLHTAEGQREARPRGSW